MINNVEEYTKEEAITFHEFATRLGIDDLDTPEIYDVSEEGYEILSFDHETGQEVWKPFEAFVVKENTKSHYQLNTLHGTAGHRVFFGNEYVRLEDHPGAELVNEPIQVVDCQVADTHNYIAEGQINHNTTTPGGMAIPYASSVRLKIGGGSHIEVGEGSEKRVIGVNVSVKTIKNKVAAPFRSCEFEIHFGRGIVEHEQLFDVLRQHCDNHGPVIGSVTGKRIRVEGTGGWKSFTVTNPETGEVLVDKKFYKPEFAKMMVDKQYSTYIDDLVEAAFVRKGDKNVVLPSDIDQNSYSEVEAAAMAQVESEMDEEEV